MKRRQFLLASAAASALPLAPAFATAQRAAPPRFALAHRAADDARWCDASLRSSAGCSPRMRLTLEEIRTATASDHPLRRFDVELMYRLAAGGTPYAGYRWARQSREGFDGAIDKSRSMSLVLESDQIAALRITYAFGDEEQVQTIALTDAVTPLAASGRYALVGPDRDGRRAGTHALHDAHDDRDVLVFSISAA